MSIYNCAICNAQRCEHVINEAEYCSNRIEDLERLLNIKCDELKEEMILNGKLRTLLADNKIDHEL